MFVATIEEWGKDYGIRISKRKAKELGLVLGDVVSVNVTKKSRSSGFGMFKGTRSFKRDKKDDLRKY